jgi:hypothetical protein
MSIFSKKVTPPVTSTGNSNLTQLELGLFNQSQQVSLQNQSNAYGSAGGASNQLGSFNQLGSYGIQTAGNLTMGGTASPYYGNTLTNIQQAHLTSPSLEFTIDMIMASMEKHLRKIIQDELAIRFPKADESSTVLATELRSENS